MFPAIPVVARIPPAPATPSSAPWERCWPPACRCTKPCAKANALAAHTVTLPGTQTSFPTRAEAAEVF